MDMYPDVPTLRDFGYDFSAPSLYSIAAPKGISRDKVEILDAAIKKVCEEPDFKEFLVEKMYMISAYLGHEKIPSVIETTYEKMGTIIEDAGLGKQ